MATATTLLPTAPRATCTPTVVATATPHRHTPTPRASTSEAHMSTDVAIILRAIADITGTAGSVSDSEGILPLGTLASVYMMACIVAITAIITRILNWTAKAQCNIGHTLLSSSWTFY